MERALNQYSKKILHNLVDKYETSKSFNGENKVNQSFRLSVDKTFPKYKNDADYETFAAINDAIAGLVDRGFVHIVKQRNDVIDQVALEIEALDAIYKNIDRKSRQAEFQELREVLMQYESCDSPVGNYAKAQLQRLDTNKKLEFYTDDISELADVLRVAAYILENENEIFIRDLSIRLLGDSKKLKNLQAKIQGLLFKYGEFQERESVFEECGIVNNPTYVIVKGQGVLKFQNQSIDLATLKSDIGISTKTIKKLLDVEIVGKRIITIENLTTFYDYSVDEDFVIYLGGFHNQVKARLLEVIYQHNPDKVYLHFGDIDVGGFYIYQHLCKKTGIPFQIFSMNRDTLEAYRKMWKPLVENDRKRMVKLRETLCDDTNVLPLVQRKEILATLDYMEENGCKLEQEAIEDL